jgi:hypothetical protein
VLFSCCSEPLAPASKRLNSLEMASSVLQHGFNRKNKPELRETFVLKGLLLAIPAGFEPATHGVEIRYSETTFRSGHQGDPGEGWPASLHGKLDPTSICRHPVRSAALSGTDFG